MPNNKDPQGSDVMIFFPSGPIAHAAWQILAPIILKSIFNGSWTKEDDWELPTLVDSKVSSEGRGFILRWLQALGRVLPRGTRAPKPIHPPPFFWH